MKRVIVFKLKFLLFLGIVAIIALVSYYTFSYLMLMTQAKANILHIVPFIGSGILTLLVGAKIFIFMFNVKG